MLSGPQMSEEKWSALAMLRVWGEAIDGEAFTKTHGISPDKTWRRGEVSPLGRTAEHSGFSVVVADSASPQELEADIASFLAARTRFLRDVGEAGAHVELDVGLMVYPMVPKGFSLPPALLRNLGNAGINLRITGYPCSDDEEQ